MPLIFQIIILIVIIALVVYAIREWLPPLIPQPFLNIILLLIVLLGAYWLGVLAGIW